jgi:hypothetical protein
MPLTRRRPTTQSSANPLSPLSFTSASANGPVTHEVGPQEVSSYAPSHGRGSTTQPQPVTPAALRLFRASPLAGPPALQDGTQGVAPIEQWRLSGCMA